MAKLTTSLTTGEGMKILRTFHAFYRGELRENRVCGKKEGGVYD